MRGEGGREQEREAAWLGVREYYLVYLFFIFILVQFSWLGGYYICLDLFGLCNRVKYLVAYVFWVC